MVWHAVILSSSLVFAPASASASPALPEPGASEPAATPSADPLGEPSPEPPPEPPPEPIAAPEPEPAVSAPIVHDDERAPSSPDEDASTRDEWGDRRPVRRAEAGDWAMQFTFGGLAPLSIAGVREHGINRLLMTELGFRRVFDKVIIPFSIGAGVFHHNPDGSGASQNDAGLSASVGVLVPFRVWRRIVPYAGPQLHLHYLDPTGDNNWLVNFSIGGVLGTEVYVHDRISLLFQGLFTVGVNVFDGLTQVSAATSLAAGGNTGLVFYF